MSSVFPKWSNRLPQVVAAGLGLTSVGVVWGVYYYWTPDFWEVGYEPDQPVDYSHALHAGQLGIDCRYCHTNVEESGYSNVPDTETCMNCHTADAASGTGYLSAEIWNAHQRSEDLMLLRESYASGKPVEWRRVHKLPDYVQFNHAVHVNAGVSCYSCHGRIDQMPVVYQAESLAMGWCLDCHRNPHESLVDVRGELDDGDGPVRITDLARVEKLLESPDQAARGADLADRLDIAPPQNCGACHY